MISKNQFTDLIKLIQASKFTYELTESKSPDGKVKDKVSVQYTAKTGGGGKFSIPLPPPGSNLRTRIVDALEQSPGNTKKQKFPKTVKDRELKDYALTKEEKLAYDVDEKKVPKPVTAKEVLLYRETKDKVYFNKGTWEIVHDTGIKNPKQVVDLTDSANIYNGIKILPLDPTLYHLPKECYFVRHYKPTKDHPGSSIAFKGFLISATTPEWKENKTIDPINSMLKKLATLTPELIQSSLTAAVTGMKLAAKKVVKEIEKDKQETAAERPAAKNLKITKDKLPAYYRKIDKDIKGSDPLVFDSWGTEETIKHKWDGKYLISAMFTVDAFLFKGTVAVSLNAKTLTYTMSLLRGDKPTKVQQGIASNVLNQTIDRAVEYEGDKTLYTHKVKTWVAITFPETVEKPTVKEVTKTASKVARALLPKTDKEIIEVIDRELEKLLASKLKKAA